MILVSVLGDFHSSILPMFYDFKDNIKRHILIYDDFKRDVNRAKEIQKGLQEFKKKYNFSFKLDEYVVDEDSQEKLDLCAKFILSKTKKPQDLYINTTDGFSTLTTVLNQKLHEKNVNFIAYDMYDNEYNILNKNGIQKKKIKHNLNIRDHFLLKGYSVIGKEGLKAFADDHELTIKQLFEKYQGLYNKFLKLSYEVCPSVENMPQDMELLKNIFTKLGLGKLKKQDSFLTGGLFELYIYNLVKNLNYDDIEVGLTIERNYLNTPIPNEFDIFIMKNNHLHMIECKFLNVLEKTHLIYKYIALANIIDEDGSMIIVTKKNTSKKENISVAEKRGRMNNIVFKSAVHKNPLLFNIQVKSLFGL